LALRNPPAFTGGITGGFTGGIREEPMTQASLLVRFP